MESIDMYIYIYISAMKAVRGFLSRIYQCILRKRETRPRADMFTRACPPKEKGKKCKILVRFHPFNARWRAGRSRFSSGLCRYA